MPKTKKTDKTSKKDIREYNIKETYNIGETIYHKTFDDNGVIIEAGITSDSVKKIVVDFKKNGKKKLVMSINE